MTVAPSDFTFITTCKGRLEHLKQSLPRMCAQNGAKVVVVDYACPDGTADWVRKNFPDVTVAQETDDSGFVIARARNMGALAASTPWIMFIDADMLVAKDFLEQVLPQLHPTKYYRAAPWSRQNWGTAICTRAAYSKTGGYDEVYRGWGVEDDDFYDALEFQGARRAEFPAALLSEVEHTNDLRTKFHEISMMTSFRINMIYRQIKLDLMYNFRSPLPLTERQRIFNEVKRRITNLENGTSKNGKLKLHIPDLVLSVPPSIPASEARHTRMTRAFQYEILLDGAAPSEKNAPPR